MSGRARLAAAAALAALAAIGPPVADRSSGNGYGRMRGRKGSKATKDAMERRGFKRRRKAR